jgi:hypothetical protein
MVLNRLGMCSAISAEGRSRDGITQKKIYEGASCLVEWIPMMDTKETHEVLVRPPPHCQFELKGTERMV